MNPIWFLRMKRWAQNPPSAFHVKLVLGVILFCALLFGIEKIFGFPDWLTPNPVPRGRGSNGIDIVN